MNKEILISWIEAGMVQVPSILLDKYKEIGLDEKELVLLLHVISFIEKGNEFPTPQEISTKMNNTTNSECTTILRKLIQLEMIKIEEGSAESNVRYEKYSLKPLWTKLANVMIQDQRQQSIEHVLTQEKDLYTIFEKEFGRPLSPMECESLAMWLDEDGQSPDIIKAALRESVISGKVNFRYIDRILFDWKKSGIETLEQAKVHGLQFRQNTRRVQQPSQPSKTVPFYNWLEK